MRYLKGSMLALAILATTACESRSALADTPSTPPPMPVSVVEVQPENVPIYSEYVAQTFARDMVEIRGRVDGYVEKRLFDPGSEVRAGQPLYVLDLRPYEADVEWSRAALAESEANLEFSRKQVSLVEAEAALAQAKANLLKAKQDVTRLTPLVERDAAPKQDLDNATAALTAMQASVEARQASVEQARLSTRAQIDTAAAQVDASKAQLRNTELNLGYATIYSPISGKVGDSLIQVGGLVSRNSPEPLTTVVPLDPVWVRFKVSEAEQLAFRSKKNAQLELILGDGSVYPLPGRIENTLNQVDSKTGTLEVQATFPNPKRTLLPGQFGRVRVRVDDRQDTILVPQRAVQELQGLQSVLTVGGNNQVQARSITTGDRIGEMWVVEKGLNAGDRVIVEGLQKTAPGAVVDPQPYEPAKGGN